MDTDERCAATLHTKSETDVYFGCMKRDFRSQCTACRRQNVAPKLLSFLDNSKLYAQHGELFVRDAHHDADGFELFDQFQVLRLAAEVLQS